MKRILPAAALLAAALLPATAAEAPLFTDKVIAKGEGFEITQSQLDQAYLQRQAQMAAMGRQIPDSARNEVEKETLDLLLLKSLLLQRAKPEDHRRAAQMVQTQIDRTGEETLAQQAKIFGLTTEAFKQELIDQTTATQVVERDFKPKVIITTEQARKFYDDNPAQFEQPEMVRAAHVLLMTRGPDGKELDEAAKAAKRTQAEAVLERARKGDDFAGLAKEFSEDPGSKDTGGEYTFPRGRMVPAFEQTAFSLEPGQVSDIVTTQFGFHIIKLLEKLPAKLQDFAEVEPQISSYLTRQELQKSLRDFVDDLKAADKIQVLEERYKS